MKRVYYVWLSVSDASKYIKVQCVLDRSHARASQLYCGSGLNTRRTLVTAFSRDSLIAWLRPSEPFANPIHNRICSYILTFLKYPWGYWGFTWKSKRAHADQSICKIFLTAPKYEAVNYDFLITKTRLELNIFGILKTRISSRIFNETSLQSTFDSSFINLPITKILEHRTKCRSTRNKTNRHTAPVRVAEIGRV